MQSKNLMFLLKCLLVTLSLTSVIAVRNDCCKNLKLSETPDKYASPQLYVFGGWDSGSARALTSASQFNSSVGEWEKTTSMSVARHRFCGAVDGTEIYLFGGGESAEVYDCETGIYSPYRSLPDIRFDCGAAVLDGFIYVVGGRETNDAIHWASGVRYNIQTTRRQKISPMHTGRGAPQLVALGGRLFAIGGRGTKTVEAYNATTDRWTTVASTQYEHAFSGATVHEGKIYVLSRNGFEVYNSERDEWEALPPLENHHASTLVSMNHENKATKLVHTYSTLTKKWSEHEAMDIARSYHLAFVVNH